MATRHRPKDLQAMTLRQLDGVGTELGLTFTKNHSKRARARMILDAYAAQDLERSESPETPPLSEPDILADPKPDFERLIDGDTADLAPGEPPSPGRGGVRPGAGRPEGMTDELALYNRLSKQPHPVIKDMIERLFEAWAARAQCPEVRLTKEEAVALALPWTHAYELSPVGGKIPPWLSVGFMCLWSTATIFQAKAAVAREAAKRRKMETAATALN